MDWAFTKTTAIRPHSSPTMLILHNIQSSNSGQNNIVRNRNKPTIITELQLNLQKHINICCCSFNKISLFKRKNRWVILCHMSQPVNPPSPIFLKFHKQIELFMLIPKN